MQTRTIALMTAAVVGALALGMGSAFAGETAVTAPAPVSAAAAVPATETVAVDGPGFASGAVIATVQVGPNPRNTFKMYVEDKDVIAKVWANYHRTEDFTTHPRGTIVYDKGRGENTGFSWHLTDVDMVEMSIEVCDGLPSYVEARTVTSPYYCPWAGRVIAVQTIA